MENPFSHTKQFFQAMEESLERLSQCQSRTTQASLDLLKGSMLFWNGVLKYTSEFMDPSWDALNAFINTEREKLKRIPPSQSVRDYAEILQFNLDLASRALMSSIKQMRDYHLDDMDGLLKAALNTLTGCVGEDLADFASSKAEVLEVLVNRYPQAIRDIEPEYGFHFDNGRYVRVAETDRFELYQVLPLDPRTPVRESGKPVVIVPPYVLGANILAFLPGERKSYVHAFADQGIPTYIRVVRDIGANEAVQIMTPEEDTLDTRFFCERVKARHGRPVTLNGFCQGGYMTTIAILSGKLDELVDAHITCVAPLDGSRSLALVEYIKHLPPRFRDLGHSEKRLTNGNPVIDGKILSWVYKLKSIEKEAPLLSLYRDLMMLERSGRPPRINKTAAAINYWMMYDKVDLPFEITRMSFESYLKPVSADGTLPVKLFERPLNFKRFKEKDIPWLICIAEKDDLVDEPATLVPLEWIEAEVTVFPKGHTAIATSWSKPGSECSLDSCFSQRGGRSPSLPDGKCRGPVRFQLDLEEPGGEPC